MVLRHALAEAFTAVQPPGGVAEHGASELALGHTGPRRYSCHAQSAFLEPRDGARLRSMQAAGLVPGQPASQKTGPAPGQVLASANNLPPQGVGKVKVSADEQRIADLEAKIKKLHESLGLPAAPSLKGPAPSRPREDHADLMKEFIQQPHGSNGAPSAASMDTGAVAASSAKQGAPSAPSSSYPSVAAASAATQAARSATEAVVAESKITEVPAPSTGVRAPALKAEPVVSAPRSSDTAAPAVDKPARGSRPDLGECQSADGRYVVKVTPDGVRRLYDTTHDKGRIEARIQCDGEVPKGKQGKCEDLTWPCENIHRPFRGYMEDIAEKMKPLCQTPGWHGLFVGLGGGYMQTHFGKLCAADAQIDTIETSPAVVPIARNMFGFNRGDPKQHLEFGDTLPLMKHHASAGDKYDFIFTDYSSQSSKEFIQSAHHLLKPGGRLAVSKVDDYQDDWLGSLQDFFSPAQPSRCAEGNFTIITSPKVLPKGTHPAVAVEAAVSNVKKPKAEEVEAPQAKVEAPQAKVEAPKAQEVAKLEAQNEAAAAGKTTEEKVQAVALPDATVPEAHAASLEKKLQEAA